MEQNTGIYRVGSKCVVCHSGAEHRDLSQGSMNTFVDTQQFSLTNPHPGLLCHSSAFHSWSYLVGGEKWFQFPNNDSLTCCKAVRVEYFLHLLCICLEYFLQQLTLVAVFMIWWFCMLFLDLMISAYILNVWWLEFAVKWLAVAVKILAFAVKRSPLNRISPSDSTVGFELFRA